MTVPERHGWSSRTSTVRLQRPSQEQAKRESALLLLRWEPVLAGDNRGDALECASWWSCCWTRAQGGVEKRGGTISIGVAPL